MGCDSGGTHSFANRCGSRGCLQTLASTAAILRALGRPEAA